MINEPTPQERTPLYMMYASKNFARMEVLLRQVSKRILLAKFEEILFTADPIEDKLLTIHLAVLAEGSDEDFVNTIATFYDNMKEESDSSTKYVHGKILHCIFIAICWDTMPL